MTEFLAGNGGLVGTLILVVVGINFLLSGLSKGLEVVMNKTKTETDNKLHAILQKVLAVLQKIIDWSSANRQH